MNAPRSLAARCALLGLIAVTPLAALGLASYRFAAIRLSEAAEAANTDRVRLSAELIEADLAARLQAVAGNAADPALVEPAARHDAAEARRRLAALRAGAQGLDQAFIVDASGVLWADDPAAIESKGRSFANRPWFADMARSSEAIISEGYMSHAPPQVPVVALAAPLLHAGKRIGILVHQYRIDELSGHLRMSVFGREGRVFIIDHAGHALVPHEDAETRALSATPPARGALAGRSGRIEYDEPASHRRMSAAYAPVRVGGRTWAAISRVPADEAADARAGLRLKLALATLAAALMAVLAALQIDRNRERARRQAEAQARELARSNADLEQFAYLASHDLQAPLRSLKNYTDMFQNRFGAGLDEECRRLMGLTQRSVGRMQQMISDLLEFSRLGRDKEPLAPVELKTCLDEALADLASEISRRHAVIEHSSLPSVRGRSGQLSRLLQNLLSNALKYCEGTPKVTISAVQDGAFWAVSVADNGIGIPEAKKESVFGLFERLHPWEKYEGTGIGLAACRKIVEHHGGRIWIDAAGTRGTTVRFTLPV